MNHATYTYSDGEGPHPAIGAGHFHLRVQNRPRWYLVAIFTTEQHAKITHNMLAEHAIAARELIKELRGMGIINMSPLDWVTRVMDFSQTSLDNTLNTAKEVHQTLAEIPINIAEELGMPKQAATALKYTHRRVLDHIHKGVSDSVGQVNQYMVKQAQNVDQLTNFDRVPSEPKIMELESKKEQREEIKLN